MKSERSLVDRLENIACSAESGNPVSYLTLVFMQRSNKIPRPIHLYQIHSDRMDDIVSDLFDLSLKGYYVAHVSTQGLGDNREIWFKIRESDNQQTNITSRTINALLKALEPTLRKESR